MGQLFDSEQHKPRHESWKPSQPDSTHRAQQEPPPFLLSKKWLACRAGLMTPTGRINYAGLYQRVLTPEVIQKMGETPASIRRQSLRVFSREQTVRIIEILGL